MVHTICEVFPPNPLQVRTNLHCFQEIQYTDAWSICLLEKEAVDGAPRGSDVSSIFHAKADLAQENSALNDKFYDFQTAKIWFEVGMHALGSIRWRPDCMQINEGNLKRMLPPKLSPRHPVAVGSPAMCECFTEDQRDTLLAHLAGAAHKAELQVTYGRCGRQ